MIKSLHIHRQYSRGSGDVRSSSFPSMTPKELLSPSLRFLKSFLDVWRLIKPCALPEFNNIATGRGSLVNPCECESPNAHTETFSVHPSQCTERDTCCAVCRARSLCPVTVRISRNTFFVYSIADHLPVQKFRKTCLFKRLEHIH